MKLTIPDRPKCYVIGITSDGRNPYAWVAKQNADSTEIELTEQFDKATIFPTLKDADAYLYELGHPTGFMVMQR